MISANLTPGAAATEQFISFVEGSSATAPQESAFAAHVLATDHNLNQINGGDPTDGFSPWVTDILVYPSSEYWETLLNGNRVRPYIDFSISNYNTLRIPSAIHDYDLYADSGKFYEDVTIDGTLTVDNVITSSVSGEAKTRFPVADKTTDFTSSDSDSGFMFQSKPAGSNLTITLPNTATSGICFTVMNCLAGKTTTFSNLFNSNGTILSQQYSAATVYWDGGGWYAFGDLV